MKLIEPEPSELYESKSASHAASDAGAPSVATSPRNSRRSKAVAIRVRRFKEPIESGEPAHRRLQSYLLRFDVCRSTSLFCDDCRGSLSSSCCGNRRCGLPFCMLQKRQILWLVRIPLVRRANQP